MPVTSLTFVATKRDGSAWGRHLIEARVQPTVGVMLVGGGAEPRSIWYGSGCAGFARREIRPKALHGE